MSPALINTPTVKANPFKNKGVFDDFIVNNDILFNNIEEIIQIIIKLKNKKVDVNNFKN